jgi:hypothetical protein
LQIYLVCQVELSCLVDFLLSFGILTNIFS